MFRGVVKRNKALSIEVVALCVAGRADMESGAFLHGYVLEHETLGSGFAALAEVQMAHADIDIQIIVVIAARYVAATCELKRAAAGFAEDAGVFRAGKSILRHRNFKNSSAAVRNVYLQACTILRHDF